MRLNDRVTPVTGSATGIGDGVARVLVREGAQAICLGGLTVGLTVPVRLIAETERI